VDSLTAFARFCALSAVARSAKGDPFVWLASLRSLAGLLEIDRPGVAKDRPDEWKRDADIDPDAPLAGGILSRGHARCRPARQTRADRSHDDRRTDLAEDRAAAGRLALESELERADALREPVVPRRVLPRVERT
jgi:hypothetical protein